MIPQLSPPGWTLLVIAALTIIMQTPNLYSPSAFMAEFGISNKPTAQLIGRPLALHRISIPHYCYSLSTVKAFCTHSLSIALKADLSCQLAFLLVLINGYDLMGASQDNWTVYWYSLVSRAVAMVFFSILGEPWSKLVGFEGATFAVLGIAMWFG